MSKLVLGPLLRYVGETDATVWVETDQPCEYEVRLDGEKVWPETDSPFLPSVIRPVKNGETLKLAFGSCRISAPHEPPHTLDHDEDERGLGIDALRHGDGLEKQVAGRIAARSRVARRPDLRPQTPLRYPAVHKRTPRYGESSWRGRGRLRGVRKNLPRRLVRPGDTLAPLHRAIGHDLRRSRGRRRLEHLGGLGGGDAPASHLE